jgi:hypothetical protein
VSDGLNEKMNMAVSEEENPCNWAREREMSSRNSRKDLKGGASMSVEPLRTAAPRNSRNSSICLASSSLEIVAAAAPACARLRSHSC